MYLLKMSCRAWYIYCVFITFNFCLTTEAQLTEERMAQVHDDLHQLLNQTEAIMLHDIDFLFDQINDILALEQDDVVFPGEMLQLLQELSGRVNLNGFPAATIVRDKIALLMADVTPANPIVGLAISRTDTDIFTDDSIQILNSTASLDMLLANIHDMVVILPASVRQQSRRISFVVFRDSRVLNNGNETYTLDSRVVSVNVQNYTNFRLNEQISIYGKAKVENVDNYECTYWNFLEDKTDYWSTGDCRLFENSPQLCVCHFKFRPLGYFTRMLVPESANTPTIAVAKTSTLSPHEQIQQVLNNIRQLLENQTAPILVDDINQAIDQVNDILELEDDLEFPSALLQMIDQLGAKVDLDGSHTEAVVRDNIALLIADTTPENSVIGIALASSDTDTFTEESFNFLSNINSSILYMNVSEVVVSLPLSVTRDPRRISFVVFRDSLAFNYDRQFYSVNSRVIGINIDNFAGTEEHEVVDIYIRPVKAELNRKMKPTCSFWNILENGTGLWSQEGCMLIKSSDSNVLDTCRCQHLTHFAEVLIPRYTFSQYEDGVLTAFSIIGCLFSILSLIIIVLTAILFKSWRKNMRNQIWIQLCVALLIISICHLTVIIARYDGFSIPCMLTGIMLHFSIVAAYCWMFIAGVKALTELYLPPDKNPGPWAMLLALIFSWGVPVLKVVILRFSSAFMEPFEDMPPISKFCKPASTNLWWLFFTPTAVLMVASWVVFFFVIYKLDIGPSSRNEDISSRNRDTLAYARTGLGLVLLAGLPPWIFGIFAYNIVGAYLFACTATTQGFILFLFIVCGNVPTRDLWLHRLKIRRQHDEAPLTRSVSNG